MISNIIQEVIDINPIINQIELKSKLTSVISMYNIQPISQHFLNVDLNEKIEMFLSAKTLEGLSKGSIIQYRLRLTKFSEAVQKAVTDITTNDIRMYLAKLKENNQASTVNSKLSAIRSFFQWLQEEEIIEKNPTLKIKPIKDKKRLRESLTVEELELMREACKTLRERALLEFLYATGCRLDEVVNLNKSDINWDTLSVKVIGKGNKERKVYISPKTKIHLNKYFLARKDNKDCLFSTEKKPYNRLSHRTIQIIISIIGKRAELNKRVYPHLLRHTLATLMINNGADIVTVQKILGHEDPGTTQVYAKVSDKFVQNEYRKHLVI